MSHEPDDAKDHKASKEAGQAVTQGNHKCVSVGEKKY